MNARDHDSQRRKFCVTAMTAGIGCAVAVAAAASPSASEPPHVSVDNDETARLLGYTEDANKAPAARQPGQSCSECRLFDGGAPYGPCRLYPGKVVNAKGWCAGFADRK